MTFDFYERGTKRYEPRRVMILGRPGVGKTRLAGTFPHPLFLDVDHGASSALRGGESPNRLVFDINQRTRRDVKGVITRLANQEVSDDGLIHYQVENGPEIKVGTVVIDTLTAVQEATQIYEVMRGARVMDWDMYDELLSLMQNLAVAWQSLPVHVVVICHSKKRDVEGEKYDEVQPDLAGQIRDKLPKQFDLILHMRVGNGGKRYVITDNVPVRGIKYVAKDRHDELAELLEEGQKFIALDSVGGYPGDRIARALTGGGDETTARAG
jgi:hypothetical protein